MVCGMSWRESSKKTDLGHFRDTIESIYIAIVLAFVLRAFMVEAFVIPTGSMANSLYGEHYRLICPSCKRPYAYGLQHGPRGEAAGLTPRETLPAGARCPNCGLTYSEGGDSAPKVQPCGGDRVLVLKYLYEIRQPQPWDVVVFKNPQNNRENYIKRLIGCPGETVEIVRGDIFVKVKDEGADEFRIRRKPYAAQKAMWHVLYDNDYPPNPSMVEAENLDVPRWKPDLGVAAWNNKLLGGRVWTFAGGPAPRVLNFHPGRNKFRPLNGYNAPGEERKNMNTELDICTDWKLSCVLKPTESQPATLNLTFESFSDRIRAEIHTSGLVRLLHQSRQAKSDEWTEWGRTDVGAFSPGRGRTVALSNVDYRVIVWADDKPVLESTEQQYSGDYAKAVARATIYQRIAENEKRREKLVDEIRRLEFSNLSRSRDQKKTAAKETLAKLRLEQKAQDAEKQRLDREWVWFRNPGVSISAAGGRLQLWHLNLQRDVYYTSPQLPGGRDFGAQFDYVKKIAPGRDNGGVNSWVSNADENYLAWGTTGNPIKLRKFKDQPDLDEFFCLGDNSPQSHDGRTWVAAAPSLRLYDKQGNPQYQLGTVPRYNILGRAMLVYWPAGFRLPVVNWPIVPNFGRIRLIR
jgi:signal peptidase I